MTDRARGIGGRGLAAIGAGIVGATIATLAAMGRPFLCACGHARLWHGPIDAETSQHLADWYSPSHLIHGLIFYALLRWLLPCWRTAARLIPALIVEAAWEIAENTPTVIGRYRDATVALGYSGDSIVNSLGDIAFMAIGFGIAARVPWWSAVTLGVALELVALAAIRDNLTLNVLMLLWPVATIKAWQAGQSE
ncbi:MAG: DUF2585 family protein [Sphingomonas sp.]